MASSEQDSIVQNPAYADLPRREIKMDWDAYASLPSAKKENFVALAESLEKGGWVSRTSYSKVVDWAFVDLSKYTSYDGFVRELKRAGPAFYESRKAEKRGYYSKFFDQQTFIGDIVAIDTSARERQGKTMSEKRLRTVEQRGGYATEIRQPEEPEHVILWDRAFGTFRAAPGHRQGDLVVDEELVSYLMVGRFGDVVNYDLILGHFDLLRDGIVHKLHHDFVKTLLEARNQALTGSNAVDSSLLGIRYLAYGSYLGTTDGLRRWKKSNLFEPGLTLFDYGPALEASKTAAIEQQIVAVRDGPRITEGMISTGTYDAYDKWEILCRYWADPTSMRETIVDKWNAPALPNWQDLALAGGTYACVNYFNAKLDLLRQDIGDERAAAEREATVNRDIEELLARIGVVELLQLARAVAPAIAADGFSARLDERLPPLLRNRLREVFKAGAIGLLHWTDMRGEVPSVEIMRKRKNRFPVDAIRGKRKALSLFCALNYGRSDVIHIHDICPDHVTLVDIESDCLNDMKLIYPRNWDYLCVDYLEYLQEASRHGRMYDLIVADIPLHLAPQLNWDRLPVVMSICTDTFISHYSAEMCQELGVAPDDLRGLSHAVKARTGVDVWFIEMIPRNDTIYWAVMRRS